MSRRDVHLRNMMNFIKKQLVEQTFDIQISIVTLLKAMVCISYTT